MMKIYSIQVILSQDGWTRTIVARSLSESVCRYTTSCERIEVLGKIEEELRYAGHLSGIVPTIF